ncbi:TetR/AcrR family transcriptional regulator C-terminal domain-containing protein [Cryptosporangium sp. NPDC051539]|uniref:TetR/AcrR family transcriptional regulator C-terminal domain-containing protein n=1 Tax=Cryptosporangium sp. NPDC051539 TaxID=3363962 RepID=UPI0037BD4F9C
MVGRPGPRRVLTEEAILDAALALLDEGGLEAASIRRIAAAVGVAPNAVYTYFPDKAAVLGALVDRFLGTVEYSSARPWRERIRGLAVDVRTRLSAHPAVASLLMSSPMGGPNTLAIGEFLLEALDAGGLAPDAAARASYLVMVYVLGALALEAAEHPDPGPLPPEAERITARREALGVEAPAGDAAETEGPFPRTVAAAPVIADYVSTAQFLWGLDRVLDGIAAS